MGFFEDESGQDSAEPVELYQFVLPNVTYRYTSHTEDYTFSSNLYTREAISRGAPKQNSRTNQQELLIQVPVSLAVVEDMSFTIAPRNNTFTLTRVHPSTGNSQVIWTGRVTSAVIQGRVAEFRVPSLLADALKTAIPPRRYSKLCNHQLYDTFCTVARTSFDHTLQVASIRCHTLRRAAN
jgi:hypothetical protein